MTTVILRNTFVKIDELGITQRGINDDGTMYVPIVLLNGHPSRTGESYLPYINDEKTQWVAMLGAPYGTDIWQFHDDERQNGCFKTELADAKSRFILKKESMVSNQISYLVRLLFLFVKQL